MSFTLDVKKFAESFIDGAEQATRGASISLFNEIIASTPVDEGRARANWFATGKQPSTKITATIDKDGSKAKNAVENKIIGLEDWSTFTLTNNLPYINKLEFGGYNDGPKTSGGFSKQSPVGMVRVNISRYNFILDQEAKKVLPK